MSKTRMVKFRLTKREHEKMLFNMEQAGLRRQADYMRLATLNYAFLGIERTLRRIEKKIEKMEAKQNEKY